MDIIIRKATPDDASNISALIKNSMGFDNPAHTIKENLERIVHFENDLVLVAVYNEEIIGLAHAEDYDTLYDPPLKDLMSLAVKTEYQNMKIGTKLMEKIEQWAKDTGRKGVRVLSASERVNAHKFYQALGYSLNKYQANFHKLF